VNSHKHARLTPKGRVLLVKRVLEEGWTMAAAAQAAGVSRRTEVGGTNARVAQVGLLSRGHLRHCSACEHSGRFAVVERELLLRIAYRVAVRARAEGIETREVGARAHHQRRSEAAH